VEPIGFLFIRREDHEGTLRPVEDAGKKVCGGGAFQAVNPEQALLFFQEAVQGAEEGMGISLPTHGNFPLRVFFGVQGDSNRKRS
jgi:hypothetical protein